MNTQNVSVGNEYLMTTIRRFMYYKNLGDKSLERLSEAEIHFRPNEETNNISIIVQHLHGNMLSRWTGFLTEDGEKSWRMRDSEFESIAYSRMQVLQLWNEGWSCLFDTLEALTEADLMKQVFIRGENLTAIDAINRQLAHYCYHVGQLVFLAKMIKNTDWVSLSIPRNQSQTYNQSDEVKDPARKL